MKTREIKELTVKELKERIDNDRAILNRLMLNHTISPLDNPAQIRDIRKRIARVATELRLRENNPQ
ncbi:50S ribosomal protein L29 [Microbacter margulisiae]|uniref:Large ribosomal subunit protein uL29 n=1 Tax=Microbacter margulisiae TaxID=1350067 RepID=A0A7W5DS60_9PORP|nr:50S ribosomal protein L29 [Microbacter margulisiae]MBB3188077.1 large subunit ribosomal protein L29 [Microbacter margulisiae]